MNMLHWVLPRETEMGADSASPTAGGNPSRDTEARLIRRCEGLSNGQQTGGAWY